MSTTVDNKVVRLELDNKQFESGAKQSGSTLEKLKGGMNFDEQNKKLSKLGDTSKKVFLQDMSESLNQLSDRFSVKGVAIMSTISNLTNRIVDAGVNMAKALTIDPITSGLSEYETQMNAIQTIMANTASKGNTLEEVNDTLNELNVYADKTIYNFSEMTRNIGTFTAAGVGLKESTAAIKGIANLAAMSGSSSQQASTAMYQLSQALAAGTVKLMDWNSVVNAGMGGENFQNALKETARVHGTNVDAMIEKEGSFRDSLQYGWITSEILIETLQKYTGDLNAEQLKSMGYTDEQTQKILALGKTANEAATKIKTFTQLKDTTFEALGSGWAQSWQIIIGDFNDARDTLTSISDTINK
ncbi:MAG: tape measure protein, partial [Enterococcus sp.]|nr:tape measure protein [Enterococcus sp.]